METINYSPDRFSKTNEKMGFLEIGGRSINKLP